MFSKSKAVHKLCATWTNSLKSFCTDLSLPEPFPHHIYILFLSVSPLSVSLLFIPILPVFMSALTKFLNVFSVVIYEILVILSSNCIFGDKSADLCAAFALLFSNTTLQPNGRLCWLSSSFDFFCWWDLGFCQCCSYSLIFFRHGGYCCLCDKLKS